MKTKILIWFTLLLLAIPAKVIAREVEGTKQQVDRVVELPAFTRIQLMGVPTVYYKQTEGDTKVKLQGLPEELDRLNLSVEGDALVVRVEREAQAQFCQTCSVKIYIESSEMRHLAVYGSGQIKVAGTLQEEQPLSLHVSGSGSIATEKLLAPKLKLDVLGSGSIQVDHADSQELEAQISGSGLLDLAGKATHANYTLVGSGRLKSENLEVKHLNVKLTGSGQISCFATDTLSGSVKNSGKVLYKGKPVIQSATPKKIRKM